MNTTKRTPHRRLTKRCSEPTYIIQLLQKKDSNGDPYWFVALFLFGMANLFFQGTLPLIPLYLLGWL